MPVSTFESWNFWKNKRQKNLNYLSAVFISFCDLEKDSLASFDVKIAAACLVVHCGAYSSACSGSELEIEWSGTIVIFSLVHNNRQMRKRLKEPTLKWFSWFLWCFEIYGRRSGRFYTLNIFWSTNLCKVQIKIYLWLIYLTMKDVCRYLNLFCR